MTTTFDDHDNRLANLISYKTRIDQQQTAGWTPGAPVHTGLGCHIHGEQMIPVADGISLEAEICTPKQAGAYPSVVLFSAYGHQLQQSGAPTGTNETGEAPVFTERGYNHVVVSRRGMGRSDGDSVVYFNDTDVDDHAAVIDWVSRQEWCNGDVFLFGTSYYAVVQPEVAVRQPPALRGFFAYGTDTDYFSQIVMTGGAPQIDFLTLWMGANFTETQEDLQISPTTRAALSHVLNSPLKTLWQPQVQKRITNIMDAFKKKAPSLKYRELLASWLYDGKTRATNTVPDGPRGSLDRIQVPFVVVNDVGSFNLHQYGAYEILEKAGTPVDKQWLILTPPEYALPVYRWQLEALAFFDHIAHGADNGYGEQPRLRYHADGRDENDYSGATSFPLPDATKLRYYLDTAGDDAAIHVLALAAPTSGSNAWAATPFGAVVPPGMDEVANPTLAFETLIAEETELVGPVTASLAFTCNEIDSHVIARVARVDLSGELHILSMGSIRPVYRDIDEGRTFDSEIVFDLDNPRPLVPGQEVELKFSLTPFPVVLQPGERLRIDLGSRTDQLRANLRKGYEHFDMMVPPYFSRNTIRYGESTYVEFDRVPVSRQAT
jgi:putative CocE/NonD family hydrolase